MSKMLLYYGEASIIAIHAVNFFFFLSTTKFRRRYEKMNIEDQDANFIFKFMSCEKYGYS
jgi:hypothetical protein